MATKKQIDQESLRRMMRQKKEQMQTKKIDHPCARYNKLGQLSCTICQTNVKSEALWQAHLLSRSHKLSLERSQQAPKRPASSEPNAPVAKVGRTESSQAQKTNASLPLGDYSSSDDEETTEKKGKTASEKSLPADFFSSSSGLKLPPRRKEAAGQETTTESAVKAEKEKEKAGSEEKMADILPEGFFDDPVKDAMVRQVPYKSKIDEELESFQKAMKEMTRQSEDIIEEDDEQMDAERNLSTIDELMDRWQRVNQLELRKEKIARPSMVAQKVKRKKKERVKEEKVTSSGSKPAPGVVKKEETPSSDEDSDVDPDDRALMWRSKRML